MAIFPGICFGFEFRGHGPMRGGPRQLPFRRPVGLWGRLERLLRFRLIIPMLRSQHTPEYTARGVMMGLIWAFTPSVGFQMPLVFGTWLFCRRILNWDFSLIQGLAWTWLTNAFTALPCYYVFFLTGQVLLGNWSDLSGYQTFIRFFESAFSPEMGIGESVRAMSRILLLDWGVAMSLGSLPWAALMGWIGYRLSLRFVVAYRDARLRRMASRAARMAEKA
jgi:uncharacterized protein (DUF2062 family)